jgi:lauroyl/myristoyl acyltransferase
VPFLAPWAPAEVAAVQTIGVPSPNMIRLSVDLLRSGVPVGILPEFNLGPSGQRTAARLMFLARAILAPTGPARIARLAGSQHVLFVDLRREREAEYVMAFEVIDIGQAASHEVARAVMARVERAVIAEPELWWSWPVFASHMLDPDAVEVR